MQKRGCCGSELLLPHTGFLGGTAMEERQEEQEREQMEEKRRVRRRIRDIITRMGGQV